MKKIIKTVAVAALLCTASAGAFAATYDADGSMTMNSDADMNDGGTRLLDASDVRELQQELADRGFYSGSIDGIWGPRTTEAIRGYQRSVGVAPTGALTASMLDDLGVQTSDAGSLNRTEPAAGESLNNDQMDTSTNLDAELNSADDNEFDQMNNELDGNMMNNDNRNSGTSQDNGY